MKDAKGVMTTRGLVAILVLGLLPACGSSGASRADAADAAVEHPIDVDAATDASDDTSADAVEDLIVHGYSLPSFPGGEDFFIRLPPTFSPFLPLSGDEATREPAGFYDTTSPYYFSYGFIWWLQNPPDLDTASLRGYLRDYYGGLCKGSTPPTVTLEDPTEGPGPGMLTARRKGTLETGVCFNNPVPVASVETSTYACPDHTAIIVMISPQPAAHQVWADLHTVRDGFNCW